MTFLVAGHPVSMEAIAHKMRLALETPENMSSLAAHIAKPIEAEIKRKEISSLLLTEHALPAGERPVYQKKQELTAHWISKDGHAQSQEIGEDEVEFPTFRVHTMPEMDVSVLRHGNVGRLLDYQTSAANTIRKKIDQRTIKVISEATPASNVIEVAGDTLTAGALNAAMAIIEDQEVAVKYIIMRGGRFADVRDWNLDPVTKLELRQKGIIKNYGTASIMTTASAEPDEILLVPDHEIGKLPIREKLKVEVIENKTKFKVAFLSWQEVGHGITRPDLICKIRLRG